ncbi:MAG TPA: phospho-N-acetylmuramoyl-pentapeptide-transferase [Clostridiales bacterium]|nr:phospho-N-acetylmuramoyl-pentapeptide-transferase [Clostridiales bacterium]
MNSWWTLVAAVLSFIIAASLGKWLIPYLKKLKCGQTIRDEGPKWHMGKSGTPTMGGLLFIISSVVVSIILFICFLLTSDNTSLTASTDIARFFAGIVMALLFGAIGFFDDYIKVVKKRNLGLTAKQKLILQFLVAIAYLTTLYLCGATSSTYIPLIGRVDLGVFYWIIAAFVIVGIVNATNLTDGLDGLDGSITFFASLAFMVISSFMMYEGMAIMSAALAGGCLGFLVWNFYPAKVFMGDTGSLFLGGFLCALAFGLNMPILIIPIGIIYIIEMLSVMLQVTYFKLTHGKRLFKMSPIHHHFEMCGWSEVKVTTVFSMITLVFGALSFLAVYFGMNTI